MFHNDGMWEELEIQSFQSRGNRSEQKIKEAHVLTKIRQRLEKQVTYYFSAQLCKVIFEEKEKPRLIKPIDLAKDPQTAQMIKHIFLLTEELEKIANIFGLLEEPQEEAKVAKESVVKEGSLLNSLAGLGADWTKPLIQKPMYALKTLSHVVTDLGPKMAHAQEPIQAALHHLIEIWSMVSEEEGFFQKTLKEIEGQINKFLVASSVGGKSEPLSWRDRIADICPKVEQLIVGLCGVERPAAPIGSEAKTAIKLTITSGLEDCKQTGGYILLRSSGESCWKLFQVSETDSQKRMPVELLECPGLEKILKEATSTEEAKKQQSQIGKSISDRWDVSAQRRSEWLPVLHMSRQATDLTRIWSDIAAAYHEQMVQDEKSEPGAAQYELIQKIQLSLQNARLDEDGYYEYSERETPLTQSLKATYNVLWGINQLCKGYWENPGLSAYWDTAVHLHKIYNHYWKIDWIGLGQDIQPFIQRIIDSVLMIISESFFPRLRVFSQTIHQVELSNHARFGAASEITNARSLFRKIDRIYYQRGLDMGGNPSGYSEETAKILANNKKKAELNKENLDSDASTFDAAIDYYQHCLAKKSFQDRLTLFRHITNTRILEEKYQQTSRLASASDSSLRKLQQEITHTLTPAEADNIRAEYKGSSGCSEYSNVVYQDIQVLMQGKKGIKHWGTSIDRRRVLNTSQINTLKSTLKTAQKIRSHLADQLHAVDECQQAIVIHEQLRTLDALETLEEEGIIALIAGAQNNDVVKQRTLAVLLADMDGEPRKLYLKEAGKKASEFVKNEKKIENFILQVAQHAPAIAGKIILEAFLAGYISALKYPENVLPGTFYNNKENLCYVLTHLPATCVFAFLEKQISQDGYVTPLRIFIFFSLLKGKEDNESSWNNLSKKVVIEALIDSYLQHQKIFDEAKSATERNVMNKIGLFIGRLAYADPETARLVFESKEYRQVLARECLEADSPPKNQALFYEGLVSTFQFTCFDEDKQSFINDYSTLLGKNTGVACEVYRAIQSGTEEEKDEKILEHYSDPLNFYVDIEQFIIKKLSPGSQAQKKMQEFFSAVVLSKQAQPVREEMLKLHLKTRGSLDARYLSLLTHNASTLFWQEAQRHLCSTENSDSILQDFEKKKSNLEQSIREKTWNPIITPDTVRQLYYVEISTLIKINKEETLKEIKELSAAHGSLDYPSKCLKFQTAIQELHKKIDGNFQLLLIKINNRHRDEAKLVALSERLSVIINLLSPYLNNHSSFTVWARRFFLRDELPLKKKTLVASYLKKFEGLQQAIKKIDATSDNIEKQILRFAKDLSDAHAAFSTYGVRVSENPLYASELRDDQERKSSQLFFSVPEKRGHTLLNDNDQEFSKLVSQVESAVGIDSMRAEARLEEDISFIQRIARVVRNRFAATFFSNPIIIAPAVESKADRPNTINEKSKASPPN